MNICNSLFNNMKNDVQLSTTIICLLLELNQIINSNENKSLIFDNLSQRVDNYKTLFTNMKDNEKIILSNLPKISKRIYKAKNVCLRENNSISKKW